MLNIELNLKNMMLVAVGAIAFSVTVPVLADGAGAFLGGIAVAKIGRSIRENNEAQRDQADAAQQQAYYAQQQAQQAQQAPKSAEDKIAELDTLAAGGYITPAEYKSRKKAILDSM